MPSESSSPLPLIAPTCPLCGGPNACSVATTGAFDASCWCRDVTFGAGLLARVPDAARDKACICRRCAERG